jgi:hypothetical protein
MDLSIIIVNWNSANYLRECLKSVYEKTAGTRFEVIVIDNASYDGCGEMLAREFPRVRFIQSHENLGFARANNLGFKRSTGRNVLFLNPDTKLVSPAINILLEHLNHLPDAGIVGCKLLNADLSVQTSSILRFPTILNTLLEMEALRLRWPRLWGIEPLFSTDRTPARVEALCGACMLARRDVLGKVGLFSEEYFMYSEEIDLCFKIERAGFRNYFCGDATMIHFCGKSSPASWQTVTKIKAELQFISKWRGRSYALAFRASLTLKALVRLTALYGLWPIRKAIRRGAVIEAATTKWTATLKTLVAPGLGDIS